METLDRLQYPKEEAFLIFEIKISSILFCLKFAEDIDAIREKLHSSNSMHARLETLENFKSIRSLLPEEESRKFSDDGSISNIKLYFANAFRIDAIPEGNSFKIQPVLLKDMKHKIKIVFLKTFYHP